MPQPILNRPAKAKSSAEYLTQLEDLMKRNRGGFSATAQDTGSNIAYNITGGEPIANASGLEGGLSGSTANEPEYIPEPVIEAPFIEEPMGSIDSPITIEDFLTYFNQQYTAPDMSEGIGSTPDGGILYQDGSVHYYDGTVRIGGTGDANAYPLASMPDGSVRYSDGSIRSFSQSGLEGLETGVFGQVLPTTQPYGNNNPGMGYADNTHGGVDLRTRNLTGEQRNFKLPVDTEVVQVITEDMGSPYGNSILVKLPTGEMLRFSHLSQVAQVQPGQTLKAGQVFGSPGSTGNSTAEHLDLEYYDQSGNRTDPNSFPGFPKQEQPPQQGKVLGATDQTIRTQQPTMSRAENPIPPSIQPNPTSNPAITAANAIDYAKPTGDKIDLGATEMLRNQPEAARVKQIETVENVPGMPEVNATEMARQNDTNVFRQAGGNLLDLATQLPKKIGINLPELNLSEAIAGGKTLFTTPKANASEPMQSFMSEPQMQSRPAPDVSINQPGQGIAALKSTMQDVDNRSSNVFKSVPSSQISGQKAVGENTAGSEAVNFSPNSMLTRESANNDNRDQFFKAGGAEYYKDFMKDGVGSNYRDSLGLNLFKDTFYDDPNKIANVFGNTHLGKQATDVYKGNERAKYANPDEYDQGEVDRYFSSMPEVFKSNFRFTAPAKNAPMSTPPSSFMKFSPAPQRKPEPEAITGGPNQNSSPSPWNQSGSNNNQSNYSGPTQIASPSPWNKAYKPPMSTPYKPPMSVPQQNYSPAPKPASQPKPNIFSQVLSAVKNIFRR